MWRIVLMVVRLCFKVPYYFFSIRKCGKNPDISFEEAYSVVKKVTISANKAGRVIIESYGLENIPETDGFIFYPNHQGLFDVLVFLESCPRPFSFVIKKEAASIVLLKQVVEALRAIPIDREDIRQSMKVIQKMAEEVKKGRNFLIFAEGTRNKNKNIIGEFKGGSFKGAYKAQCSIVPCALIDSYKPFDETSIKKVIVKLIYLEPILYDDYKDLKTTEIAAMVKKRIEKAILQYE